MTTCVTAMLGKARLEWRGVILLMPFLKIAPWIHLLLLSHYLNRIGLAMVLPSNQRHDEIAQSRMLYSIGENEYAGIC